MSRYTIQEFVQKTAQKDAANNPFEKARPNGGRGWKLKPTMQTIAKEMLEEMKRSLMREMQGRVKGETEGSKDEGRDTYDLASDERDREINFILNDREREILKLIAEGRTNREIAEMLFLSIKTVQAHRANLMHKLGMHDRTELVKYAIRKGIIGLDEA